MTISSFRKIAQVHCVRNTIQLSEMWFSCFCVLPGSAEAQVIWGGIVKRLLIAYFISNISAKKHQNPFMCVKVIASQRWDFFWDTVYIPLLVKNMNKQISNNRQQLTTAANLKPAFGEFRGPSYHKVLKSFVKVKLLHACDWWSVNRHLHQCSQLTHSDDFWLKCWILMLLYVEKPLAIVGDDSLPLVSKRMEPTCVDL